MWLEDGHPHFFLVNYLRVSFADRSVVEKDFLRHNLLVLAMSIASSLSLHLGTLLVLLLSLLATPALSAFIPAPAFVSFTTTSTTPTNHHRQTTVPLSMKDSTKAGLRGQTVFLTGATGGLGQALALQLAQADVGALILSARKPEALQRLTDAVHALNDKLVVHQVVCDLADAAQVQKVAKQLTHEYGTIDCLINNGGVSSRSSFLETDLGVDEKIMQINFLSGCAFAKALIPGMVAQKSGRVIWISSVQGLVGIPNRSSYAASKFAVQGYTESIRAELQADGVTVHTVSPGYIRTNLSRSALTGDGSAYGTTDATTAAGADPTSVATDLLDRIVTRNEVDFTIAATPSAVAAVYLRTLCPGLLRYLLVKRFAKSRKEKTE